jgi:threonine dehydratase
VLLRAFISPQVAEGSGALGIAGTKLRKSELKGKKVVAVVCGRNIDLNVFKRIIA